MKKFAYPLAAAACASLLPSCLQHETTIHIQKDGSGTLVEETRFGAQAVAMMTQMSAADPSKDPLKQLMSDEKAKKRATTMGDGVTFEKAEMIDKDGSKGARMTYKFKDINKLLITSSGGLDDMAPEGTPKPETPKQEPIKFTYDGDDLTVALPQPKVDEKAANTPKPEMPDNPQAEAMAKQMMSDMKVTLKIVADSGIEKTDATHHTGNTVTLMEMDMGKVLNTPGAFKKLQSVPKGDTKAAMDAMKGIDGMKMETKEKIEIDLE